ncbi:hypothetical protein GCM10012280_68550 [Wenjunlia tyrosinilytica]|uniref:Uncharacterized protein n=2 Tax=Wenjunlia tyrosinilytica TaxID=1544741 RepID=A0A918E2S5_9ACTN|nr:hypothetical protein GCM10012280_68550 [Wenjunlia tyrosinilytica]
MFESSASPDDSATPSASADLQPCPSRIEVELPYGEGAVLVKAYRTEDKQITLCRTPDDILYYYGEFTGRPETGIAMPAQETSDGFTAENTPYHYEIHGYTVTVTRNGALIGEEGLTVEPSPR